MNTSEEQTVRVEGVNAISALWAKALAKRNHEVMRILERDGYLGVVEVPKKLLDTLY